MAEFGICGGIFRIMKIVIINGSPRENGLTADILHAIEKRLLQKGAEVQFCDLIKCNIKQCKGCCACYKTGHCIYNDDAEKLSLEIANADGLVIGSPTYASNISGILKQFIDRGHFVVEQLLYGKYAVSVATGENYGSRDTSKIINKLLSYSGAKISGIIIHNAPFNSSFPNSKKAFKISDKLFNDIGTNKRYWLQKIKHSIIFSVGIRPFVKKKGREYQGVTEKWKISRVMKGN